MKRKSIVPLMIVNAVPANLNYLLSAVLLKMLLSVIESGGEAQKFALARVLYKDAPFVILDEPTSALDPVSEFEIYQRFNSFVGDKTAIYISHRLSSCRFCNNIFVFDNGQIVQQGSHDELVKNTDGQYYKLWQAQSQYYVG